MTSPQHDAAALMEALTDYLTSLQLQGGKGRKIQVAAHALEVALEELRAVEQELVAARTQAEDERNRYHELFEFAPDAYLMTDQHGRITEANRLAAALLNVPDRYVVGKPLAVYFDGENRSRFYAAITFMREQDLGRFTLNLRPRNRDISVVVQATVRGIRNADGFLEGLRWALRDITEQHEMEQKQLENERRLQALTAELSLAEERERRRIATGIHDRISQTLAVARMMIGQLRRGADSSQHQTINELQKLLEQAIEESRTLTFELSPPMLYQLGLEPAIQWLTEQFSRRHGLSIRVQNLLSVPVSKTLSTDMRVLLFQAVRELLTNVVKHAHATQVFVKLDVVRGASPAKALAHTNGDSCIVIEVTDNGGGFDPNQALQPGRAGFGVFNIRTRLEQLGGRLEFQSAPGGGTRAMLVVTPPRRPEGRKNV